MKYLLERIKKTGSSVCVGLDPILEYIPPSCKKLQSPGAHTIEAASADRILDFTYGIIDAVHNIVPCVKLQAAYYEMYGWRGMYAMTETVKHAKNMGLYVIIDGKRNDIGETCKAYASAYLGDTIMIDGSKKRMYESDALTVNPYLGSDGIAPFLIKCSKHDRDIFVLVKTSNQSASDFQDFIINPEKGISLWEEVAMKCKEWNELPGMEEFITENGYGNCGVVVGATQIKQLEKVREMLPTSMILVPGYGAQGGAADYIAQGFNKDGTGAIVNASRSIMCAWQKNPEVPWQTAIREEAIRMTEDINSAVMRRYS